MSWQEIYKKRLTTADEAVKLIKSGDRIVPGHAASESRLLIDALMKRAPELRNVEIWQGVTINNDAPYYRPEMQGHFIVNTAFASPGTREAIWENRGHFTSLMFHRFPRAFREKRIPVDVFITMVSPPDVHGYCSLGVSVDYSKQLIESAKIVIAEVNPNMPRTHGDTFVHVSELDCIVEGNGPLLELTRFAKPNPVLEQIGKNVASLIRDGDTLQIGAGTLPDAIMSYLKDKNDLGIHSEVVSDGIMELIDSGVVNGKKKTLHPNKAVATFVYGTRKIYDYVDNNPFFLLYPVDYVNNPFVISQNDNMVAINSALEIDLLGQVAAESIGPKQFSGIGGQLDFIRGAAASKNGRSIIALQSTAQNGKISRISCQLKAGTPVTTTRNDVHYVVTEYGVADLFCKTNEERAAALISIAHPNFRDQLREEYKSLFGVSLPQI
ncbi:acetyl-CoA hydrolase/transferase family protein [Sporolituus thermophilus]|uniref:4-hydroxybutyrate CoA-transferase n=1 Tax=Sporolituus thermophilus DSM 23256 TaxID=1123285 RepID=A0A1G7HQJ2_9FIRM|nr:acetyl-CoA hydrolase/transferase C-terminal domain-containing protein [Sporolituus thermophilus]SDF02568.1 4-hydroxybutyrate CoA-transferase [Sporolituus thermophilus DSM 23256]